MKKTPGRFTDTSDSLSLSDASSSKILEPPNTSESKYSSGISSSSKSAQTSVTVLSTVTSCNGMRAPFATLLCMVIAHHPYT